MKININAPINKLSYGIVSTNFIHALYHLQHNVSLFPIGSHVECDPNYEESVTDALNAAKYRFDTTAPSLRIFHQHSMAESIGHGLRIGMPIFELDTFSAQEKHHLKSLDLILVNSKWAKSVIEDNGIKSRCELVPLGYDPNIFRPAHSKKSATVFLVFGKWEKRKNHHIIPELFDRAFNQDDNVELWFACSNHFLNQEQTSVWEKYVKSGKLGNKVKIIPRMSTHSEVANLMRQADCGLFISSAEGWNLECLEMMACGKHVIATNYSGHTEFCTKENSLLVDIKEKELANDGIWFHGTGWWAKIGEYEKDQIIQHMKTIHTTKQEIGLQINQSMSEWTWIEAAKKLISSLERKT